jgi:hypothetical protein
MNDELRRIRAGRVLRHLDVSRGRGLEIGPLNDPFVRRADAEVRYVDVHPTELLRMDYAGHTDFDAESIVEVDHWLIAEDGQVRSLAEATAASAPFEWAVASHVIEHVPDLLTWLGDVADVLVDDGLFSLVIPDRRYTFDAIRAPTSLGQVLQARHDRDVRPSVRAVFDSTHYARRVPPKDQWHADAGKTASPVHPELYVAEQLELAREGRRYLDAHVWVWTPEELVGQLATLAEMGLIEFAIRSVMPTPQNGIEFYVTLRRLARGLSPQRRREELHDSYSAALSALAASELVWPYERPQKERGVAGFLVSPAEQRVILAKRALLRRLYVLARRVAGFRAKP